MGVLLDGLTVLGAVQHMGNTYLSWQLMLMGVWQQCRDCQHVAQLRLANPCWTHLQSGGHP